MKFSVIMLVMVFAFGTESAMAFTWPWKRPKKEKPAPQQPLDPWSQYIQNFSTVAQAQQVRPEAVARTVSFLQTGKAQLESRIVNRRYVTVADMTQQSTEKRLIVLDLQTGSAARFLVSHGWGSGFGPKVYHCSNRPNSKETPPGFMLIGNEKTQTQFGNALYLYSLEPRNDNSYARTIIFHPNKTAAEAQFMMKRDGYLNMSEGCTQLTREDYSTLKPLVRDGSLLYNFCPEDLDGRTTL
ncbi:MAG: murein L,D-transpeptidase catalytic domain family protein [Bdellovibrionales bacterium]|nr:murein L,D-transpeptidase catalytic domain family protein [Bdellovibrionales bacterium]